MTQFLFRDADLSVYIEFLAHELAYLSISLEKLWRGGPRDMKYKSSHSAAIFLRLCFTGQGCVAPPPPGFRY